jgi:hypothetical protein
MKKDNFLPALRYLFICAFLTLLFLTLLGCAKPNIQMPKPLPPIVKEYKHVTVFGGRAGMKNTGVYIVSGDPYSILATGSIDFWPRRGGAGFKYHDVRPEQGWPFLVKVGEHNTISPFLFRNGFTRISSESGHIYLGYKSGPVTGSGEPLRPQEYKDDQGAFHVDIIVWNEPDWIKITSFLSEMLLKDRGNEPVTHALWDAERYASIARAEKQALAEIEKTEKQISELQTEAEQTGKPEAQTAPGEQQPTEALSKEDKIAQLQSRLAKLLESQAQLEEMKKELEEEKKKTNLMAEALGEKERREQELLTQLAQGVKNPPVIMIASPKDGGTVNTKTVDVSGVVEDLQGIDKVAIFINNRPLEEQAGRGFRISEKTPTKRLEFAERIPLDTGENIIKIRATDTKGFVSEKKIAVKYVEIRKNFWAVVIGINDYPNAPKLKWAVNDARAFYQHLVDFIKIPEDNVILLLNQDANLTHLRSMLGTYLKKRAGREDMVIIYFAGHGATEKDMISPDGDGLEKYLLPFDADPKDLYASALPMREISHIFYRIQSERLIFIADCCYSGTTGGRTIHQSGVRANISDAFLDRISSGKGRIILTASGANEVSTEDDKLQHGIFTYYLLKGLKGPADADSDGLVSVDEAYRYVTNHVPRATGQEQHPVKKGTVEGRLILSIIP